MLPYKFSVLLSPNLSFPTFLPSNTRVFLIKSLSDRTTSQLDRVLCVTIAVFSSKLRMEDQEFIDDIIYRLELQDALDEGDSENIQNKFGSNTNLFSS